MNKKEKTAAIVNQLIRDMEVEGTGWIKAFGIMNQNINGYRYTGINQLSSFLSGRKHGFESKIWGTFKQIKAAGGMVRKGQKSSNNLMRMISGKGLIDKTKPETEENTYHYAFPSWFPVFNIEQSTLKPADFSTKTDPVTTDLQMDTYISNTGAMIKHSSDPRCYYSPVDDFIHMANKNEWSNVDDQSATNGYYTTLLHEIAHWSGHEKRLDRKLTGIFKDADYAVEELVAEISAAMLAGINGLQIVPSKQHAKYLNGWLEHCRNDSRAFIKAVSTATKAVNYIDSLATGKVEDIAA